MDHPWDKCWTTFVERLAEQIRSGSTEEMLTSFYGGKSVTWCGTLDEKDLDELAPSVAVSLPPAEMDVGQGRHDCLDCLGLPIEEASRSRWEKIDIGDQVRFTATFTDDYPPFPAIAIKELKSGRVVVLVSLRKATPLAD